MLEDIKSIGVVGGGVMGGGISQSAIVGGYQVVCRDLTDEIVRRTRETIVNGRFGLRSSVERGKLTQEQMEQALARLSVTSKVEDLKDCDVIIEAVGGDPTGEIENKDVKLRVFAELDELVKREAIFASNTSKYTIATLAAATNRKNRFVGTHFFSPASIMKLVEVTYTSDVSEELVQLVEGVCHRLGKTTIRVKDVPGDTGFVVNRIYRVIREEAQRIVDDGIATVEDVNLGMMLGRNWPVGPLDVPGAPNARSGWQ